MRGSNPVLTERSGASILLAGRERLRERPFHLATRSNCSRCLLDIVTAAGATCVVGCDARFHPGSSPPSAFAY